MICDCDILMGHPNEQERVASQSTDIFGNIPKLSQEEMHAIASTPQGMKPWSIMSDAEVATAYSDYYRRTHDI